MHVGSHSPDSRLGMRSAEGTAGPSLAISPALAEPERTASSWLSCPRDAEGRGVGPHCPPQAQTQTLHAPNGFAQRMASTGQSLPPAPPLCCSVTSGGSLCCVLGAREVTMPLAQPALPQPHALGPSLPSTAFPAGTRWPCSPPPGSQGTPAGMVGAVLCSNGAPGPALQGLAVLRRER